MVDLQQEGKDSIVEKLKEEMDKLKANVDRLANRLLEERPLEIMCDLKQRTNKDNSASAATPYDPVDS